MQYCYLTGHSTLLSSLSAQIFLLLCSSSLRFEEKQIPSLHQLQSFQANYNNKGKIAMKSSIFSDTKSVCKQSKSREIEQIFGSATKSEGSRFKASQISKAQVRPVSKKDNNSVSSKSYLLQQFARSEADVYTPTKASSYCQEQFEEDRESEIEEIRQLINQNKQISKNFYRTSKQQSSCQVGKQFQQKLQFGIPHHFELEEDNKRVWALRLCILVMIIFLLGAIYKIGGLANKEEAIKTLGSGLSTCWDNFKKENCDLNNPVGPYCKKLLQCTLNKQSYEKEKQSKRQNQESIIEEVCVFGFLSVIIYFFGVKKTMSFFFAIFNFLKKIYQLKFDAIQEENDPSQQDNDSL